MPVVGRRLMVLDSGCGSLGPGPLVRVDMGRERREGGGGGL